VDRQRSFEIKEEVTMKKLILFIAGIVGLAGIAWASSIVYSDYLANEIVAYGKTYTLDLKTAGQNRASIDTVAATAVLSSGTLSAVSWADGGVSIGTFTVSSLTSIDGAYATNTITVSSTSTLKNAWFKLNGRRFRNGYDWKTKATTALTAADIAAKLNHLYEVSAATSAPTVVTLTARVKGTAANDYTLTKYGSGLAVGAATFSGGLATTVLTINGTAVPVVSTDTAAHCATMIAASINAEPDLMNLVTATPSSTLVILESNAVGVNAYTLVSNFSGITRSGAAMTGGTASAYTIDTPTISVDDHGLTTGTPVLYSTAGFALGGLTNQTTYYAIAVDTNSFQLAETSTGAVAGDYITLTSSSTVGPHTFTVTPTATAGTWGLKWQVSDDSTNWYNMAVTSVTFATPYTQSVTSWNLGEVGHRYLRLDVDEGTGGAVDVQVSVTGRNSN
jgi:hypothetical protein